MKPLVSIIIPIYNRAQFLPDTLASVLAQTYRPIELILVDNGSSDDSQKCCEDFRDHNTSRNFIVHVASEAKPGACACRNTGARHARGEYISFFDSDDEMSPSFILDTVDKLEQTHYDVVAVATQQQTSDGSYAVRQTYYNESICDQILTGMLTTQSLLFRRSFYDTLGGWDEALLRWNDWELAIRMLLRNPLLTWIFGRSYHHIRIHPSSITGSDFSHSASNLLTTLAAVHRDICTSHHPERHLALRTLYFRAAILAGHFKREGNAKTAAVCLRQYATDVSPIWRIAGRGLYLYTYLGARGAWRIARALMNVW